MVDNKWSRFNKNNNGNNNGSNKRKKDHVVFPLFLFVFHNNNDVLCQMNLRDWLLYHRFHTQKCCTENGFPFSLQLQIRKVCFQKLYATKKKGWNAIRIQRKILSKMRCFLGFLGLQLRARNVEFCVKIFTSYPPFLPLYFLCMKTVIFFRMQIFFLW